MVKDFIKRKGIISIFVILFFLLLFYFILTIRSFAVYEIVSNDKNLTFESGYYTKSNFKIIININNISYKEDNNDKNIISQKLKLCTVINSDKECFYESENIEDIDYKNFVGYNLTRNIGRNLNDNLYLVVETIYEDNTVNNYQIKLPMKEVIASDLMFYSKKDTYKKESYEDNLNNIDDYKLDTNGYSKIENSNIYYKVLDNITLYFDLGVGKMSYTIKVKDGIETYSYFYNQDSIEYSFCDLKGVVKVKYIYIKNKDRIICSNGNCNEYSKVYDEIIKVFNKAFS